MWKQFTEVFKTTLLFLCFRSVRFDMNRLGKAYLLFGIVTAWIVGIGRYWDHPKAELWQYAGLGSVLYIFMLALILWLLLMPLKPRNWSYQHVLTFVGLTSLPAILYAIPVERMVSMSIASSLNVGFLAIVAIWRVALFMLFLRRVAGMGILTLLVSALLPLGLIVSSLTYLNLEHVVFRIMAGLHTSEQTANDAAYSVLMILTFFSLFIVPIVLLVYLFLVYKIQMKHRSVQLASATTSKAESEDLTSS